MMKHNSRILFQGVFSARRKKLPASLMADASEQKRVAFSPGEFAKLFGKSQTWGYRQIYSGKAKAITEFGRTLIAAAEAEAILKTAGIYDGLKSKAVTTKSEIQALAPQLPNVWRSFLVVRRQPSQPMKPPKVSSSLKKWPSAASTRQAALARLSQRKS